MDTNEKNRIKEQFAGLVSIEETFPGMVFDECEFHNCTFTTSRFDHCRFLNCAFSGCDLSNIVPMTSEFRNVKLKSCKAIGIDWTQAAKVIEISFTDCIISYSNFRLMKIPKTTIKKCEAKNVDFIETDLTGSILRNSDFEETTFFKTNLTEADLSLASNYNIDPNNNTLHATHFSLPEAMSLLHNLDIILD